MQWLLTNWIWVLVGILFFGMHILGHGGHGGHGGHSGKGRKKRMSGSGGTQSDETPEPDVNQIAGGHRH